MAATAASPKAGLEGLTAGATAICRVEQDDLLYRGYSVNDLAENATYEEVAFLLLVGHKPSGPELAHFKDELVGERPLPAVVTSYIRSMEAPLKHGSAVPMDVVRTAVSLLGNLDPESQHEDPDAELRKSKRLLAKIPTIIGQMQNVIDGRDLVAPETGGDHDLSHAGNLLYLITGEKPAPEFARVVDVSLILYAEHDFNASTFTSRVIAATLSDLHGSVTGAIAALKGRLHGGANEAAMDMLKEIRLHVDGGGTVKEWLGRAFAEKRKLMGFGHRVYKNGDHRAPILHALGRSIAEARGADAVTWFEIGEETQRIMLEEKSIHPNVDFPCGLTYYTMGIPVPQYTPIFVAARTAGWCAHVIEQHANNRLIRPLAEYVGPETRQWSAD
ncbi:MAG: citrate/2-methylcitrate synthase [Planctomycetota bacterium]